MPSAQISEGLINLFVMKHNFILSILILSILFSLSSCRNKKIDGADTYCDSIIALQNNVLFQVDSFFQSTRYVKYDTRAFYDKAVSVNDNTILKIKELGGYNGEDMLNVASLQMLSTIGKMLAQQGKEIVHLDSLLLQNYDHKFVVELDSLETEAITIVQRGQSAFDSCQVQFLENFGFDVIFDDVEIDSTRLQ